LTVQHSPSKISITRPIE